MKINWTQEVRLGVRRSRSGTGERPIASQRVRPRSALAMTVNSAGGLRGSLVSFTRLRLPLSAVNWDVPRCRVVFTVAVLCARQAFASG